jgi:hypothetical protein
MTKTLDEARPGPRHHSQPLAFFASATLLYPLVVVAMLYGEWFLAWSALGHPPRPSLDDPKHIGSNWMHAITGLALFGLLPVAGAALILNVMHLVINRPSAVRSVVRFVALVEVWVAVYALISWDPGRVFYWWAD